PDLSNLGEIYDRVPAQSLDYGIMEKAKNQMCIPCDLGWSDVGSWDEVAKLKKEVGEKYEVRAGGNFVSGLESKVYGLIGIDDLIVVDTQDALLIAKKGDSQSVKELLDKMKSKAEPAATDHIFEHRPWGSFEVLKDTERFKSKIIRVEPGQQISYQSHEKRAEHWVITRGTAEVTLDGEKIFLKTGENVFIPVGAKHQIRNSSTEPVEFVEVQVGSYFGEDDIKRYSDIYGRS
ncbi:MAG: cupin domain-containing protein, partial [Bdellovibrionales bacterium]|nr:cupin domain-containing protein [Bdellovibrionales bacterium]